MWTRRTALPAAFAGALIVVALAMLIDRQSVTETAWLSTGTPPTGQLSAVKPVPDDSRVVSARERAEALARAQVWQTPKIPIGRARFGADRTMPSMVECRFRLNDLGGTTPKFHCVLESGRELRAKYGP